MRYDCECRRIKSSMKLTPREIQAFRSSLVNEYLFDGLRNGVYFLNRYAKKQIQKNHMLKAGNILDDLQTDKNRSRTCKIML